MTRAVFEGPGGLASFVQKLKQARPGLEKELRLWMEALGEDFLQVVAEEITRRNAIDTGALLASFRRGGGGNVFELSADGLTLEVGTDVPHAALVNDGRFQNPPGVASRFVPGRFQGSRFVHDPAAKTGLMLKQKWIEGVHFMEGALQIYEKMFPGLLEAKLQAWLDKFFTE